MAKVIKSVKEKLANGSFGNAVPFGADAIHIDFDNGYTLNDMLGTLDMKNKGNVQNQLNKATSAAVVTVDTSTTTSGALKSYVFKQNNSIIGTVDIPKDMVVSKGEVKKITSAEATTDTPAGTYIVLTLANATKDKLYINVGTLIDIYTAQKNATEIQLAVNQITNEISATIVNNSIAEGKLNTALKNKLAKAVSAVQSVTTGNESGTIAVDGMDIKVKGLESAAYKTVEELVGWVDFDMYAPSTQQPIEIATGYCQGYTIQTTPYEVAAVLNNWEESAMNTLNFTILNTEPKGILRIQIDDEQLTPGSIYSVYIEDEYVEPIIGADNKKYITYDMSNAEDDVHIYIEDGIVNTSMAHLNFIFTKWSKSIM